MSYRQCGALLLLCIPVSVGAQNPSEPPQPVSIEGAVSHVYKSVGDTELRLHVFYPPNHSVSVRRPAILFFFGGGWTRGSIDQFVPQSKHFAERGMVAIVADYRVFGRHMTSPFEAMADAKSALRWIRSRASELGVDPDRIVASGGSAGGHIALGAAVFEAFDEPFENHGTSSTPNALVLFNPAVNTMSFPQFGTRGVEGSPSHHLRRDLPPIIVLYGKADTTVPYASVEELCQIARGLGNRCELVGYDGATHGFFNPQRHAGKWYAATLLEATR